MKKIALCMIVKNEAHIIRRCIDSVAPLVDYVYIQDTGSTDNTPQVIKDHLNAIGKPGAVEQVEWMDFASNRSRALRSLKNRGFFDYALMIDADEVIVFRDKKFVDDPSLIKKRLKADLYEIETRMAGNSYYRPQLTSLKKDFYYRGVVHEFLDCEQPIETRNVIREFFNKPIQDSARNQLGTKKFEKDAERLLAAYESEKDEFLRGRYAFYLAQSYRDLNKKESAIKYYEERLKFGGWPEEMFIAQLNIARLKKDLNYDDADVIQSFLKANELCEQERGEAYFEAMKFCREKKWYWQGYALGGHAITIKSPSARNYAPLFSEDWVYDYGIKDELSILSYYTGHYKQSYGLTKQILQLPNLPASYRTRVEENLRFAEQKYLKR
jgi:glycosyltransferase involved in cell wall biosynthesis